MTMTDRNDTIGDNAAARDQLWSAVSQRVTDRELLRGTASATLWERVTSVLRRPASRLPANWPERQRSSVGAIAPVGRLFTHLFIGMVVLGVVAVGGFRRPTDGLEGLVGIDPANLPMQTRLLLGPRVSLIETRDSLMRPASSITINALAPVAPVAPVVVASYIVQIGDTVWDIGARFNVGMYSVLWSNDLDDDAVVRPGQELRVPPVPGVAHRVRAVDTLDAIAQRYKVEPAVIVEFNGLKPGEALVADDWLVVPDGALPITARVVPVQAPVATRPAVRAVVPQRAAPAAPAPGRPAPPVIASGRLQWPTRGSITTYFSGWHPAIDIAAPFGTAISVADGGRVVSAGWDRNGYGNRIIVNHGDGVTTTYNHLSSFLVQVGQPVSKGQVIGRMGSTGNSTGPHLHFEILRNGSYVNPLAVLN